VKTNPWNMPKRRTHARALSVSFSLSVPFSLSVSVSVCLSVPSLARALSLSFQHSLALSHTMHTTESVMRSLTPNFRLKDLAWVLERFSRGNIFRWSLYISW
jgi:hypothetical protein